MADLETTQQAESDHNTQDDDVQIEIPEVEGVDISDINYISQIETKQETIKKIKTENNDLREHLKRLSDELTKRLEKLRVRTSKKTTKTGNRQKVLLKENEITEKQILQYETEIEEQRSKIKIGSEIDKIQELEDKLYNLTSEVEDNTKKLRYKNLEAKKAEKTMMKTSNDQDNNMKLHNKLEEEKFLKKKLKDIQNEENKKNETLKFQEDFLQQLTNKYKEFCTSVGEEPYLEINSGEDGVYHIVNKEPKVEKIEKYQTNYKLVKDFVDSNDPNKFVITNNQSEFDWLKEKVVSLRKLAEVHTRINKTTLSKKGNVKSTLDTEIDALNKKIQEKHKLLEHLIIDINSVRKGMRHNVLQPLDLIKEECDPQKFGIGDIKAEGVEKIEEDQSRFENVKMRVKSILFWYDKTGIIGIKPAYNHMESQLIGRMDSNVEIEGNEVRQKEWTLNKDDNVHNITVLHDDNQLHHIEIITEQRYRFAVGVYKDEQWESIVDSKNNNCEIRQIVGYIKSENIKGIEFEMI